MKQIQQFIAVLIAVFFLTASTQTHAQPLGGCPCTPVMSISNIMQPQAHGCMGFATVTVNGCFLIVPQQATPGGSVIDNVTGNVVYVFAPTGNFIAGLKPGSYTFKVDYSAWDPCMVPGINPAIGTLQQQVIINDPPCNLSHIALQTPASGLNEQDGTLSISVAGNTCGGGKIDITGGGIANTYPVADGGLLALNSLNPGNYIIDYYGHDLNGNEVCHDISIKEVQNNCPCQAPPAVPGAVIADGGNPKVCPGEVRTYSVPYQGCRKFIWTAPLGAAIILGQNTNTVVVSFGENFTADGIISVFAQNDCGFSASRKLSIKRNKVPAVPGAITVTGGNPKVCPLAIRTYTVPLVNEVEYTWIPAAGSEIGAGQGSNSVIVGYLAAFLADDIISVKAKNGCGVSPARSLAVKRNVPVPKPGGIVALSANSKACPGDILDYIVPQVADYEYVWTAPVGGAIVAGQNTNAASVGYGAGFVADDILFVATKNGCGLSAPRGIVVKRNHPKTPGFISGPVTNLCGKTATGYSIANDPDVSGYVWGFSNANAAIAAGGAGLANNSIAANFIGTPWINDKTVLTVSAWNGCGISGMRSLTLYPVPVKPDSVYGNKTPCPNTTETYYIRPNDAVSAYQWTAPAGSTISDQTTTSSSNTLLTIDTLVTIHFGSKIKQKISVEAGNNCGWSKKTNCALTNGCGGRIEDTNPDLLATEEDDEIKLFPNPASDFINIEWNASEEAEVDLWVISPTGQTIQQEKVFVREGSNTLRLDLSAIPTGIYMIVIGEKNKPVKRQKFMLN